MAFSIMAISVYKLHQHCTMIPLSPYPAQHLSLVFLVMAILTSKKYYFILVLICISLMTSDAEHLFMDMLAFCTSS